MNRAEAIEFLVEHANSPRNRGRLSDADVAAAGGNPHCGDVVTVYLKVEAETETVTAMSFEGEGCTISRAAASVLSEMARGMSLADIEALDYSTMMDVLGREVVRSRPSCATVALSTLKTAVKKYRGGRATAGGEGGAALEEPAAPDEASDTAACHGG